MKNINLLKLNLLELNQILYVFEQISFASFAYAFYDVLIIINRFIIQLKVQATFRTVSNVENVK
jgi:hypothetical protein